MLDIPLWVRVMNKLWTLNVARGGHDLLRSLLVLFRGERARVGQTVANLVIVFEAFKRSHNLKAWLHFAPKRGKFFLASYTACICSVVALWSWEIQILTECHRILSYLLWYLTIVSVGRSVCSYIGTDLLSTHKGSSSKGGCICTPITPWICHCYTIPSQRNISYNGTIMK